MDQAVNDSPDHAVSSNGNSQTKRMTTITRPYSPFLNPGNVASNGDLALLALSRQMTIPNILRKADASNPTDQIANTRFGSFPHSTLLNKPWGSQVVASNVNARDKKRGKKRKRDDTNNIDGGGEEYTPVSEEVPAFEAAAAGFAHLLYPTPELWTYGLPHRTQVVYTPDYSYIIQKVQARPGDVVLEAGAGSGSFTHAAARAVFSGFREDSRSEGRYGHVYSFEYHEPRFQILQQEIKDHGLNDVVTVTHRDVYKDGFITQLASPDSSCEPTTPSVDADAIFLDLPAPWLALPHLTRKQPSPLNPHTTVRLCTFSPCIEQVTKTVEAMREYGWLEIDMVEIIHRRIDVRRDRVGLFEDGQRGVNQTPATVDEAVERLRLLEAKQNDFHDRQMKKNDPSSTNVAKDSHKTERVHKNGNMKNSRREAKSDKLFKRGTLVHKSEPELKTHTSYLVFAVLPREWTAEDEQRCLEKWPMKRR